MATPEERKAKLRAEQHRQREAALSNWGNPNSEFAKSQTVDREQARVREEQKQAEIEASVRAKAPELYAPKRQYADPGSFAGKMLPGGAPNQLKQLDLSGMKQKTGDFESHYAERKAALAANRFQQNPINIPSASKGPTSEQSTGDDSAQQAQAQQAQRLAGIQAGMNAQTQKQQAQNQKTEQADEQTRQQREEIKKVAKATMRRGAIYVTDLLAAAVDIGSIGISFIVDIFIYMLTLGWLNLEMIYGKYFAKGKSKFVGPISWDPIPMAIDKEALILQGFVVAADLAVGVAILVLSFGGFCLIHDYVKVTSSITEAAQIGAALARGESGGLCLSGIITSAFGL